MFSAQVILCLALCFAIRGRAHPVNLPETNTDKPLNLESNVKELPTENANLPENNSELEDAKMLNEPFQEDDEQDPVDENEPLVDEQQEIATAGEEYPDSTDFASPNEFWYKDGVVNNEINTDMDETESQTDDGSVPEPSLQTLDESQMNVPAYEPQDFELPWADRIRELEEKAFRNAGSQRFMPSDVGSQHFIPSDAGSQHFIPYRFRREMAPGRMSKVDPAFVEQALDELIANALEQDAAARSMQGADEVEFLDNVKEEEFDPTQQEVEALQEFEQELRYEIEAEMEEELTEVLREELEDELEHNYQQKIEKELQEALKEELAEELEEELEQKLEHEREAELQSYPKRMEFPLIPGMKRSQPMSDELSERLAQALSYEQLEELARQLRDG